MLKEKTGRGRGRPSYVQMRLDALDTYRRVVERAGTRSNLSVKERIWVLKTVAEEIEFRYLNNENDEDDDDLDEVHQPELRHENKPEKDDVNRDVDNEEVKHNGTEDKVQMEDETQWKEKAGKKIDGDVDNTEKERDKGEDIQVQDMHTNKRETEETANSVKKQAQELMTFITLKLGEYATEESAASDDVAITGSLSTREKW